MQSRLRFLLATLALGCTLSSSAHCQDRAKPIKAHEKLAKEKPMGYFLGYSTGQRMFQQGFKPDDFDNDAFVAGIIDALSSREPSMNEEQLKSAAESVNQFMKKRHEVLMEQIKKKAAANKIKSDKWIADNAKKKGVKTLKGGVQYKVMKKGNGGSPSVSDIVKVHYEGKLTSGKVFDSSLKRGEPMTFRIGEVIKGWQIALQNMKVGDKWMVYIPPNLGYGEGGSPGLIGPNEVLVFEVELLEII